MVTSGGKSPRALSYSLLSVSAVLLALQVWLVVRWISAFENGHTQSERVGYYLEHLPLGLGHLGTTNLTWLSAACGALGFGAALIGRWHLAGAARVGSGGLAALNAILVLWSLFTLM